MDTTPTAPKATPITDGIAAASRNPSASAPARRISGTRVRFSPKTRKTLLVLHILGSLTWLGLDVGLLALSLTGYTSDDPATVRAVYLAMNVLGNTVLVPAALIALVTGVVLGVGTKWGLVRYRWVLVKLVITLITATATIFALRAGLRDAAAEVRELPGLPSDAGGGLLAAPIVSLTCYVFMTVISVYKPWGRTRWGRSRYTS